MPEQSSPANSVKQSTTTVLRDSERIVCFDEKDRSSVLTRRGFLIPEGTFNCYRHINSTRYRDHEMKSGL